MGVNIQNAISLGIGADTKEVQRQINAMNRVIKSVTRPVQDLDAQMKLLNMQFDEGAVEVAQYERAIDKLNNKLQRLHAEAAKARAAAFVGPGREELAFGQGALKKAARDAGLASRSARQAANAAWMDEWDRVGQVQDADARKRASDSMASMLPSRADLEYGIQRRADRLGQRSTRQAANAAWMEEWDRVAASNAAMDAQRAEARSARRSLLDQGSSFMSRFDSPSMAGRRDMREAYSMYRDGAIGAEQYARAIKAIRFEHSTLGASFAAVKNSVVTLLGPLVLVYKAFETFTESIRLTAQLEEARAKFKVFTGSVQEANKVLAELRQFSKESPVSFTTGQDAVSTMVQLGIETGKAVPMFKAMAEITGGNSERLQALAYAYAQVGQAGRLMGQEHIQMVNAGFSPLRIMAKTTGQSFEDLRKAMYEGKVSFDDVTKAMMDAVGPGGDYHGLMNEIALNMQSPFSLLAQGFDEVSMLTGLFINDMDLAGKAYDRMMSRFGFSFVGNGMDAQMQMAKEMKRAMAELDNGQQADPIEAAKKRANDVFLEDTSKLKEKLGELRMGEDAYKRVAKAIAAMSGEQQKQLQPMLDAGKSESEIMRNIFGMSNSDSAIAAYNEMKQLQDDILATETKQKNVKEEKRKLDQEAKATLGKLKSDAERALEKNDPQAALIKEIAQIRAAQAQGLISGSVSAMEQERLFNESRKDQLNGSKSLAPVLTVGSQEAYKALVSASAAARDRQAADAERQRFLMERSVAIEEESKKLLERIAKAAEDEATL